MKLLHLRDRVLRVPFVRDMTAAVTKFSDDDGGLLAASVAYYGALSFFPLILILIAVLGAFLRFSARAQNAQEEVVRMLAQNVSPEIADAVAALLGNIEGNAGYGGPLGVVTLLVAAIGIFYRFEMAFDRIWNLPKQKDTGFVTVIRTALFDRVKAFAMLLCVGGLLICLFISGIVTNVLRSHSGVLRDAPYFWEFSEIATGLTVSTAAFTLLYHALSKVQVKWSESARGGLLAAVLWEAGRQGLAAWVVSESYGIYGVVGSFIALMLWIYFAANIVFLGAEYVQVICTNCQKVKEHVELPEEQKGLEGHTLPAAQRPVPT